MYENNIYSNSENGSYTTFQTGSSAYSADGTYNTGAGSSNGKKEGKKKMRSLGTVQIPTEAFMAVLKLDEES